MAQLREGSVIKKTTGDEAIATVSDMPSKVSELENDSGYVTNADLGDAGFGDMVKSIYDTNNNGIVDNAEKVNGFTVESNVPANAKFTDTVYSHPSTHPYSMITGAPTSLPANGGQATSAKHLIGDDTRNDNSPPSTYMSGGSRYEGRAGWQTEFKRTSSIEVGSFLSGTYCYLETKTPWSDSSGGYPIQIAYGNGDPVWRIGVNISTWSAWKRLNEGGDADTVDGKHANEFEPQNPNIQSHISNTSNPHSTTKSQVGLGSVLNYRISTQSEAENGTSNTKYMTPLRTKQAINKAMANVSSGTEVVVGNIDPNNNNVHWIDTSI